MNFAPTKRRYLAALAVVASATSPFAFSQLVAPAPNAQTNSPKNEAIVQLTPFEVKSDSDTSYGALQSNSLTAFSTDLNKTPATAEVFTDTFIKDTQSQTIEELLLNYSGGVGYNPADASAYTNVPGDRDGSGGISVRGFSSQGPSGSSNVRFDGFFGSPSSSKSTSGTTPSFIVERVEVLEGPQSLLYGAVGAGGVVNATLKRAQFGQKRGSVRYMFSNLGSKEALLDYNAGADWLAVRFAATNQSNKTTRMNIGSTVLGYYGQVAVKLGKSTLVRLTRDKYQTLSTFAMTSPNFRGLAFPTNDPNASQSTNYLALKGLGNLSQYLGGAVSWNNVNSFAGQWAQEPNTVVGNRLAVETTLTSWLSAKVIGMYDEGVDFRNFSTLTLVGPGGSNPYNVPAIQVSTPRLNTFHHRQKAAQVTLLGSNDFFNKAVRSKTALIAYANHLVPYGAGTDYYYWKADSDWQAIVNGPGSSVGVDYGRTMMGSLYIPINNAQISSYPLFHAFDPRVTVAGQNYILAPRIVQSAAFKGVAIPGAPTNPYGWIPEGTRNPVNGGNSSNYNFTNSSLWSSGNETHEKFISLANYTEWFHGRLATLVGVSADIATSFNFSVGTPTQGVATYTYQPWTRYNGYELGAIFQVTPWMGVFAVQGTAATPGSPSHDIYGNTFTSPRGKSAPEIGVKFHTEDARYSAQVSWERETTNHHEAQSVDASYRDAINPTGINGRLGGGITNSAVPVDRASTGLQFTASANPIRDLRFRLNVNYLFVRVLNTVSYPQVYNDQFKVDTASGQLQYANGAPIYVNGAATAQSAGVIAAQGSPGAVPLTLAMLNNPGSPYYAQPDVNSGSITNASLRTILTTGGAAGSVGANLVGANGASATGATGLPLSSIQYAFASPFPNAVVPVFAAGNVATGYPGWQWNAQTDYSLHQGPLAGLGVFLSARVQYSIHAYYTSYPSATLSGSAANLGINQRRVIVSFPPVSNVDLGIHYSRRLRQMTWSTRLTIRDLFNHDRFFILPSAANPSIYSVTQRNQPRAWSWSNEIDF